MMAMFMERVRVLLCLRLSLLLVAVLFGARNSDAQAGSNYVAYGFYGSGAAHPVAGLLLASDGNYWGTTTLGGTNGRGTIFSMTPAGAITVAYSFAGTDGEQPRSPLVENVDGTFFGTTSVGGTFGYGTVFRFDPTTGNLTSLHSFTGDATEYGAPNGIMQASDGNFYGTTAVAIFKITSPPGLAYSVLHTFDNTTEGSGPQNNVVEGSNGLLYGSLYGLGGAPNQDLARIYSIPKTGGLLQILGSSVVAETGPETQDAGQRRAIQLRNRGECLEKLFVVGDNSLDLSLLQHGFGDPYGVGIGGFAPGKISLIFFVPSDECAAQRRKITLGHECSCGKIQL